VLYVTHDQDEAFTIADRVVLMNNSRIVQIDTPQEIYNHPGTTFVANFLGFNNLVPGTLVLDDNQVFIDTSIGRFKLNSEDVPAGLSVPATGQYDKSIDGQCATLFIRPDGASLEESADILLRGTVVEHTFRGRMYLTRIEINGSMFYFEFPSSEILPQPSEEIAIGLDRSGSFQILPDC